MAKTMKEDKIRINFDLSKELWTLKTELLEKYSK